MATLRFYHDYLSQPARAVGLLLEAEKVPYEKHVLKLAEGRVLRMQLAFRCACTTCAYVQGSTGKMNNFVRCAQAGRSRLSMTTASVFLKGVQIFAATFDSSHAARLF